MLNKVLPCIRDDTNAGIESTRKNSKRVLKRTVEMDCVYKINNRSKRSGDVWCNEVTNVINEKKDHKKKNPKLYELKEELRRS